MIGDGELELVVEGDVHGGTYVGHSRLIGGEVARSWIGLRSELIENVGEGREGKGWWQRDVYL